METNNYSWNKTLKFAWGHIIAFVALIFISYIAYMGEFYSNGGNFLAAVAKIFVIDICILITFIGAQILKGTDEKFRRSMIKERILICLCPVAFIGSMIPYNHFWNVYSERNQIEEKFTSAISKSKQMFYDYDLYADNRIANYDRYLTNIINYHNNAKEPDSLSEVVEAVEEVVDVINDDRRKIIKNKYNRYLINTDKSENKKRRNIDADKKTRGDIGYIVRGPIILEDKEVDTIITENYAQPRLSEYERQYERSGFSGKNEALQKENYIQTLRLQLKSQNTDSLQYIALKWINNANSGASIWNAFLIGNIGKISDAIKSWNETLYKMSEFKMSNEPDNATAFYDIEGSYAQAIADLEELKDIYENTGGIAFNTVWSCILLFLMLLFPYILQERNTRAAGLYRLIPTDLKIFNMKKVSQPEKSDDIENKNSNKDNSDIYSGTF